MCNLIDVLKSCKYLQTTIYVTVNDICNLVCMLDLLQLLLRFSTNKRRQQSYTLSYTPTRRRVERLKQKSQKSADATVKQKKQVLLNNYVVFEETNSQSHMYCNKSYSQNIYTKRIP